MDKLTQTIAGVAAGGFLARIMDEAMPETVLHTINFGAGRKAEIRPSAALGAGVVIAGLLGLRIPGGPAVLGIGTGMLTYEAVMEGGDDVAALVLGLEPPAGQPAPGLPPPAPAPGAAASLAAPYGYYPQSVGVPDYTLQAAMAGLGQFPVPPMGG